MKKWKKALIALCCPSYWRAITHGVAPGVEHGPSLPRQDFASVIDVGANKGQFATFARRRWPKAHLICFEPLPGPRAKLSAIMKGAAEIHGVALGASSREEIMHIASRMDSSSMLPLGNAQKRLFKMEETQQISVPVRRLDELINESDIPGPALLKIDVQGFEYETLKGAERLLKYINAIYVEVSFIELYEGQKLGPEVEKLLSKSGFKETGRFNVCKKEGREIQADILFERPPK